MLTPKKIQDRRSAPERPEHHEQRIDRDPPRQRQPLLMRPLGRDLREDERRADRIDDREQRGKRQKKALDRPAHVSLLSGGSLYVGAADRACSTIRVLVVFIVDKSLVEFVLELFCRAV
jgi:hypothetical protein